MDRSRKIVRVSLIGVLANVLLASLKAAAGLIAGSIAVILDAVNNLSDAFSSVVTIVGTKLANRPPDKKHPYGHGRTEYISSVTIGVIVALAGISSFKEAIGSILHPEAADYPVWSLAVIAAAVIVKFFLGRYVKRSGEELRSESLVASGTDATFDCVISASTLVTALISLFFHVNLEGWLGAVISVLIVKAGVEILAESVSSIVGSRAEGELTQSLREMIHSYDGVLGVYDLILHRYGPEKTIGSAHIEVADSMTARELHLLTRRIAEDVYREFGIVMTIGVYASNEETPEYAAMRRRVEEIARAEKGVLGVHAFYVDPTAERVTFDLVLDFDADAKTVYADVFEAVSKEYPTYRVDIVLDVDYSD